MFSGRNDMIWRDMEQYVDLKWYALWKAIPEK